MLLLLPLASAQAWPPQVGLGVGPAVARGESPRGGYTSVAPATALDVTWHLGAFESWLGVSGSLLLAATRDGLVPSALFEGELGLGVGGRAAGAGIYAGNGIPGPVGGAYVRVTVPTPGWVRRTGVESRVFYTPATDDIGLAFLVRIEPGRAPAVHHEEPY